MSAGDEAAEALEALEEDIVTHLPAWKHDDGTDERMNARETVERAGIEIKRLRTALEKVRDRAIEQGNVCATPTCRCLYQTVRRALGEA